MEKEALQQLPKPITRYTAAQIITLRKPTYRPLVAEMQRGYIATDLMRYLQAYLGEELRDEEKFQKAFKIVAKWATMSTPGLMIAGPVGVGKSTILTIIDNMLFHNLKVRYTKVQSRAIQDIARCHQDTWELIKKIPVLLIDDLGAEGNQKVTFDYGNVRYPVEELLEHRYNKCLNTVVTTNLSGLDIQKLYGDRVADRINDYQGIIFGEETRSYRGNSYELE